MVRVIKTAVLCEERELCFNIAAMQTVSERFGGINEAMGQLDTDNVGELLNVVCVWLAALIDGAAAYRAALRGEKPCEKTDPAILAALISPQDCGAIGIEIRRAITAGQVQEVEVAPGKNAEATQDL